MMYKYNELQLSFTTHKLSCKASCKTPIFFIVTPTPQLQPLPIVGLGYQWSLDFVGPMSLTPQHNCYVLVMIEHFSKWLELVPLLDCNSEGTTYAFMDKMFNRFGVPIEVLIDQGTKFQKNFQDLC